MTGKSKMVAWSVCFMMLMRGLSCSDIICLQYFDFNASFRNQMFLLENNSKIDLLGDYLCDNVYTIFKGKKIDYFDFPSLQNMQ